MSICGPRQEPKQILRARSQKKTTRRRASPASVPATQSPAAATQPDSSPAFTSQQSAEISRVVQDAVASCMASLTTSMGLPVIPPHAQPTVAAATAAQRAGPVSGDVVVPDSEPEYVQPSLASALRPDQESLFLDGDLLAPEHPPSACPQRPSHGQDYQT